MQELCLELSATTHKPSCYILLRSGKQSLQSLTAAKTQSAIEASRVAEGPFLSSDLHTSMKNATKLERWQRMCQEHVEILYTLEQ